MTGSKRLDGNAPEVMTVILIIVATGLAAFSIRLFQPIGTSVANLQLCFFASYIALFLLGLHAGERRWLESFPEQQGMNWFTVVLAAGIPAWFVITVAGGAPRGEYLFVGGLTWQSFAYAFWESFVAIGFSLGLIAFFRKFLNVENGFTRLLSQNSFGIYMFHAPILITISLLLRSWHGAPLLKFAVVVPIAYAATLAVSSLILRRIPGLRAVLNKSCRGARKPPLLTLFVSDCMAGRGNGTASSLHGACLSVDRRVQSAQGDSKS